MRAVIQRVSSAYVTVTDKKVGEIGPGLLVFFGVAPEDTEADGLWLAKKICQMRIFPEAGKVGLTDRLNRSVIEAGGEVLVVSQFSLYASLSKGNRPSFRGSAHSDVAIPLYETFLKQVEAALGRAPASGRFGTMMTVGTVNDGPVTILLDSKVRE